MVPQLVNYWREKRSLLFSSRSQPEQLLPLLLARVNGKRRVSTQCLLATAAIAARVCSIEIGLLCQNQAKVLPQNRHGVLLGPGI